MADKKNKNDGHHLPLKWVEDGYTVVRSTAWSGPGCHEGCGVLLYTKDGKLEKVEGDPEHPYNQGRLCPRCVALPETVNHPDRLKYPLKRVGERGEGKWERISWDEAYDICEKNYKEIAAKYGPWSIVGFRGTGRDTMWQIDRMIYAMGSPNSCGTLSGNSCFAPRAVTYALTMGAYCVGDFSQYFADRYDNPAWELPETIIVWGCNPINSNPDWLFGDWIVQCMKRGSKLIVVDPRLTWLAARADIWLPLRPGTDAAVALGMLDVILKEDLYDHDFVDKWTFGFEELVENQKQYSVEKMAETAWIPKEKLIAAARMYAKSKNAAIQLGVAIDMQRTGTAACHAITAMMALTGNLDIPGGNVFAIPPAGVTAPGIGGWGFQDLPEENQHKLIGYDEYPLVKMGMAVTSPDMTVKQMFTEKPYPLKGGWIQGTNTLPCMGTNPDEWYEGMKKMDFIAGVDLWMTPTLQALADVVLPCATFPEKIGVRACLYNLSTTNQAIEPMGEVKSDAQIILELGSRFDKKMFPWNNYEEELDALLKASGMTFKEVQDKKWYYPPIEYKRYEKGLLREDGQPGFNTPTGRIELFSTVMDSVSIHPLPFYDEPYFSPVRTPELFKEYPIILMTGARIGVYMHSEGRQIPKFREIQPYPQVEIHPSYAAEHGISEGDWVWIENPKKVRIRQRAKITQAVRRNMALAQHGWWFPEVKDDPLYGSWDVNSSRLMENGLVGETGFGSDIKCILCKIYKVQEGEM
jgi:anaerobic selenocysteine-containing dehydrogenase